MTQPKKPTQGPKTFFNLKQEINLLTPIEQLNILGYLYFFIEDFNNAILFEWAFKNKPNKNFIKFQFRGASRRTPPRSDRAPLTYIPTEGFSRAGEVQSPHWGDCRLMISFFLVDTEDKCQRFQHSQAVGKCLDCPPYRCNPRRAFSGTSGTHLLPLEAQWALFGGKGVFLLCLLVPSAPQSSYVRWKIRDDLSGFFTLENWKMLTIARSKSRQHMHLRHLTMVSMCVSRRNLTFQKIDTYFVRTLFLKTNGGFALFSLNNCVFCLLLTLKSIFLWLFVDFY